MTSRRKLLVWLHQQAQQHNADFVLLRQGANHEIYSLNGARIPIPRHRDIDNMLAKAIMTQADRTLTMGQEEQ